MFLKLISEVKNDLSRENLLKTSFFHRLFEEGQRGQYYPRTITDIDAKLWYSMVRNPSINRDKIPWGGIFGGLNTDKSLALAKVIHDKSLKVVVAPLSFEDDQFPMVYIKEKNRDTKTPATLYINTLVYSGNIFSKDHTGQLRSKVKIESIEKDGEVKHTYLSFKLNETVLQDVIEPLKKIISKTGKDYLAYKILEMLIPVLKQDRNNKVAEHEHLLTVSRIIESVGQELSLLSIIINSVNNFNKKYHANVPVYFKLKDNENLDNDIFWLEAYIKAFHPKTKVFFVSEEKFDALLDLQVREKKSLFFNHFNRQDKDELFLSLKPENVSLNTQLGSLRSMAVLSEALNLLNEGAGLVNYKPVNFKIGYEYLDPRDIFIETPFADISAQVFKRGSRNNELSQVDLPIEQRWGYADIKMPNELSDIKKYLSILYKNYLLKDNLLITQNIGSGQCYISNAYFTDERDILAMFPNGGRLAIEDMGYCLLNAKVSIAGELIVNKESKLVIDSRGGSRDTLFLGRETIASTVEGTVTRIIAQYRGQLKLDYGAERQESRIEGDLQGDITYIRSHVVLHNTIIPRFRTYDRFAPVSDFKISLNEFYKRGYIVVIDSNKKYRDSVLKNFRHMLDIDFAHENDKIKQYASFEAFEKDVNTNKGRISLLIVGNDLGNGNSKKENQPDKSLDYVNKYEAILPQALIILNLVKDINKQDYEQKLDNGHHRVFVAHKQLETEDWNFENNYLKRTTLLDAIVHAADFVKGESQ